jgi:hypothetical protein
VLLDLALWLSPRLSVAPLLDQVAAFYTRSATMEGAPAEMAEMSEQVAQTIQEMGQGSNLMTQLANQPLTHVPSLLTMMRYIPGQNVIEINSWGGATAVFLGLGVVGLLIGVFYLNLLSHYLPLGHESKARTVGEFTGRTLRHWGLLLLFVALVFVTLLLIYTPASIVMGLVALVSPLVGSVIAMMLAGLTMLFFFYLYFTPAALILDNLSLFAAVASSYRLARNYFWATLGFVLLTNVISIGFGLILVRMAASSPIGVAVAILVNAFIGTGLALAWLVFYRTRHIQLSAEMVEEQESEITD